MIKNIFVLELPIKDKIKLNRIHECKITKNTCLGGGVGAEPARGEGVRARPRHHRQRNRAGIRRFQVGRLFMIFYSLKMG